GRTGSVMPMHPRRRPSRFHVTKDAPGSARGPAGAPKGRAARPRARAPAPFARSRSSRRSVSVSICSLRVALSWASSEEEQYDAGPDEGEARQDAGVVPGHEEDAERSEAPRERTARPPPPPGQEPQQQEGAQDGSQDDRPPERPLPEHGGGLRALPDEPGRV